jgi:hypothetical protein
MTDTPKKPMRVALAELAVPTARITKDDWLEMLHLTNALADHLQELVAPEQRSFVGNIRARLAILEDKYND